MDTFFLAMLVALGAFTLKVRDEKRRMALLGSHLGHFQIEKLMAHLAQGYMRALDEKDPARREQIWQLLEGTETSLSEQFGRFTQEFSRVSPEQARVCKVAVPYIDRWLPRSTIDLRQMLALHAQGIAAVVANRSGLSPKAKAYMLSAELYLMQHTCHWFCKSRTVASARLLARHKTSYQQVLESVSPQTRQAYEALLAGH